MKFVFAAAVVLAVLATACTPKPETKVSEAIQSEITGDAATAEFTNSLDKLYGKDNSKFKTSLASFYKDRLKVETSDVKVDDAKAEAAVSVSVPNRKDMAGLVFMTALMDQKMLREMTLDELVQKIGKDAKPPITSSRDIKDDTIKQTVSLIREGTDQWKIAPDSKKKLAAAIAGNTK